MAVEVKGVDTVASHHLKGLRAFQEEYKTQRSIAVSLDLRPRMADGLTILPWDVFLKKLWAGEIIR